MVPSVSPVQEKLWSTSDLIALRVVSWLRHPKSSEGGTARPTSPMPKVRKAMALIDELGLDPWNLDHICGSCRPRSPTNRTSSTPGSPPNHRCPGIARIRTAPDRAHARVTEAIADEAIDPERQLGTDVPAAA